MNFIMVPAVTGIITYGIYSLFALFVRKKERLTLIEKMGSIPAPGRMDFGKIEYSNKFGALKWGFLMAGIGLGLLVGFFLAEGFVNYNSKEIWKSRDILSMVYAAPMLLFGGMGLLIAFLVEYRLSKKKTE